MIPVIKAKFDGRQFLPETLPALEPGRTYLLHVVEPSSETRSEKIAALRQATKDKAFLRDLEDMARDFAEVDSQD